MLSQREPRQTSNAPRSSPRASAAKSQAQPKRKEPNDPGQSQQEVPVPDPPEPVPQATSDVKEELLEGTLAVEESTFASDFSTFFESLGALNVDFQQVPAEVVDTSDTILYKVQSWTEVVERYLGEHAPNYLVRVAVGVLAFGRARQADIFVREHALVYWIAEGGKTLRFHNGDCFMKTPSGAFQQHRGIPPDHDRVQSFLLHVEGLFRLMPKTTARTREGFLEAIVNIWEDHGRSLDQLIPACVDACLRFEGEPQQRRGRQQPGDLGVEGVAVEGDGAGQAQTWNASTAKTIMAVKKQLSMELTQDKLLHYMSEWCDTPKQPEAGVCYEDCAVTYEDAILPAVQVERERLQNCYLRIPHCLKGTVPVDVVARLQKFYAQTFWGNLPAFRCGQAAQALAKRGLNVVRVFIGLSGGGVGQSLYSAHLQALYGHNFAFFDPQIWFHEEEMRKQVEQLNGCIILTGQETPGTSRSLAMVCSSIRAVC